MPANNNPFKEWVEFLESFLHISFESRNTCETSRTSRTSQTAYDFRSVGGLTVTFRGDRSMGSVDLRSLRENFESR